MNPKEIDSLIKLLDDTDKEVYTHIEEKLLSLGSHVIPFLETAWSQSFDALLQERIEKIIHRIQFDSLKVELRKWYKEESKDLLKGTILIAKYQYPDLDEEKIIVTLEQIKRDIWLELNDKLTALEIVKVINHIFFSVHGFSGNTANYHAPQNSYINNVLESKKGNPLSLSIIYSLIAQGLDLPIYGVNLPEHFILAYKDNQPILPDAAEEKSPRILFYINVFSKGTVFNRKEIDVFLKQLKIKPEMEYYEPSSNVAILQRLVRNLMFSYHKLGHTDKISELQELMDALN